MSSVGDSPRPLTDASSSELTTKSDKTIKKTVSEALGHRVSVLTSARDEVSTKIIALMEKIDNSKGIRGFFSKIGFQIQKAVLESTYRKLETKLKQKNTILKEHLGYEPDQYSSPRTKEELAGAIKSCKETIQSINQKITAIKKDPQFKEALLDHNLETLNLGDATPVEGDAKENAAQRAKLVSELNQLESQLKVLTAHEKTLALETTALNAEEAHKIQAEIRKAYTAFNGSPDSKVADEKLINWQKSMQDAKEAIENQLREVKNRTSSIAVKLGIGKDAKQVKQLQEQKKNIEIALEKVTAFKDNGLQTSTLIRLRNEIKDMNVADAILHVEKFLPTPPNKKGIPKEENYKEELVGLYQDLRAKVAKGGKFTMPSETLPKASLDLTKFQDVNEDDTLKDQVKSSSVNELIAKWNGKDIDLKYAIDTFARSAKATTVAGKGLKDIFTGNHNIQAILESGTHQKLCTLFLLEALDIELKKAGVDDDEKRQQQIKKILTFGSAEGHPAGMIANQFKQVMAIMERWLPLTGHLDEFIKDSKVVSEDKEVVFAFNIQKDASIELEVTREAEAIPYEDDELSIASATTISITGKLTVTKDGEVKRSGMIATK